MDSLNSDVPGAQALDRLCAAAAHELLMRSYTSRTLNRYKRVWERLTEFAHAQECANEYSRDLALRFEQAYGVREGEQIKRGERWRRHLVFRVKVLDDFARTGTIARFSVETTGLRIPVGMHKPLCEYEQYARERRHLRRTSLAERMHCIAVFVDFLSSRGPVSGRAAARADTTRDRADHSRRAYDGKPTCATIARRDPDIAVVIPPRATALPSAEFETDASPRDTHLLMIDAMGRLGWQEVSGYGKRALVETAMGRYKSIVGTRLRAPDWRGQRTEAAIGVAVLTRMFATVGRTPSAAHVALLEIVGEGVTSNYAASMHQRPSLTNH